MTPKCERCSKSTWLTNEFDEPICANCLDNDNEAAWDRQQERLMSELPPTLLEQQIAALKIKRGTR